MYISQIEFGTPEYDETVGLRTIVLRKPLGLEFNEKDLAKEYNDIHLAYFNDSGNVIGCLVLTPLDDTVIKMRQVAVMDNHQKKGVGKELVRASEDFARRNGYQLMTLHARDLAVPFYEKLAYEKIGEPFVEVTIMHFTMQKLLNTPSTPSK